MHFTYADTNQHDNSRFGSLAEVVQVFSMASCGHVSMPGLQYIHTHCWYSVTLVLLESHPETGCQLLWHYTDNLSLRLLSFTQYKQAYINRLSANEAGLPQDLEQKNNLQTFVCAIKPELISPKLLHVLLLGVKQVSQQMDVSENFHLSHYCV